MRIIGQNKKNHKKSIICSSKKIKMNDKKFKSKNWLRNTWHKHNMVLPGRYKDYFNRSFGLLIPDMINHFFKYVVEIIDESDKNVIITRDWYYNKYNYKVWRVKAFDEINVKRIVTEILIYREENIKRRCYKSV